MLHLSELVSISSVISIIIMFIGVIVIIIIMITIVIATTPNLPTDIVPTNIARPKLSGKSPTDMRIPHCYYAQSPY